MRAALGDAVTFVRDAAGLASADAELVLVDLSRPGALDALSGVSARTIGFGSHVDAELLAAARAAGYDEVLPRSKFFARLSRIDHPDPPDR